MFDIVGAGHTQLIGCQAAIDGTVFYLDGFTTLDQIGPYQHFLISRFRLENFNEANHPGGSRSSLITLGTNPENCHYGFKFINTSFIEASGAWDAAYPQLEVTNAMMVDFEGGGIDATATIKIYSLEGVAPIASRSATGLMFRDLLTAPLPTQITRVGGAEGKPHPTVTYEDCGGTPNLCVGSIFTTALMSSPHTLWNP